MVRLLGSALSVSLAVLTLGVASGAGVRAVIAPRSGGPVAVTSCALQAAETADGFPHARIAMTNGSEKNVAVAHLGLTYFRTDGSRKTQVGRAIVTWPHDGVDAIEAGGTATYDAHLESTIPPSSTEVACSVVDVQFEDGTAWSAPALATARPTKAPRAAAPQPSVSPGDDRLWLAAGTAANPLVAGAPKYCTANQHVSAWASEPCHFARLAWAERRTVAQAHTAAPATAAPATPRAAREPAMAADEDPPGEVPLLPEPTLAPTMAPTAEARPTRPSYASGPANPVWRRMSGGAAPQRTATPEPAVEAPETEPPVPSDVRAIRYTPSTTFAWASSKAFTACFGSAGGAEPLGALTDALAAKDTKEAVDDANRVYAVARPCDRTDAASALGVSELAVLQSWLYAERSFWTYADLKLRIAQTALDTASHRDGFAAIDAARIARVRSTIDALKTVLAAHPE
jgi:hypothetical protein